MAKFIHTSANIITVNGSSYPLAFFLTQEAAYLLPTGATHQYYDDAIPFRFASNGTTQLLSSSVAWATGDGYIAAKATYDAAYVTYVSYPDVATAKQTVFDLIDALSDTKKAGNISYGGNIYSSGRLDEVHQHLYRYARTGGLAATFYIRDTSEAEHVLTIDDLRLMANLIDDLHLLCDQNRDNHRDAVDLLATVVNIRAYNYTTGWPTIPYA